MQKYVILVLTLLMASSLAYGQLKPQQTWQNGTVSSDSIVVVCSKFELPSTKGALLSEPAPITTDGEMAHTLRSAHAIKGNIQPESGTSDNLSSITGCVYDGSEVWIAMADESDSLTVVHGTSTNNISTPDGTNFTISGNRRVYQFVRKGGVWLFLGSGSSGGGSSSGNVVIGDGQLLDLSAVDSQNANEGLKFKEITNCSASITKGQMCPDYDDNVWYMGTGTGIKVFGGTGSLTGCTDLNDCKDQGRVIDGLNGTGSALVLKGTNNVALKIYASATGIVEECVTGYGGSETPCVPAERETYTIPAGMFSPDSALCEHLFNVTVNLQKIPVAITCDDDNNATITLNLPMKDSWDGVTLQAYSFVHTKEGTPGGEIQLDWSGYCVESGGASGGASWAAEDPPNGTMLIDLDGHAQHDEIITGTTGNIPLSNCTGSGKKTLWLRAQVDATNTTADDSGTGNALDDQIFKHFQLEFGLKANTD